jgi:ribonuclease HI
MAIRYTVAGKEFPNAKFEKVPAHSGVKWNEAVDQLAKKAIADCQAREKAAKMAKTAKPATPAAAKPVVKTVEVPAQIKTPERMPSPGESLDLFG